MQSVDLIFASKWKFGGGGATSADAPRSPIVLLLHDNAGETIEYIYWKTLEHPPCSPDLSPRDSKANQLDLFNSNAIFLMRITIRIYITLKTAIRKIHLS